MLKGTLDFAIALALYLNQIGIGVDFWVVCQSIIDLILVLCILLLLLLVTCIAYMQDLLLRTTLLGEVLFLQYSSLPSFLPQSCNKVSSCILTIPVFRRWAPPGTRSASAARCATRSWQTLASSRTRAVPSATSAMPRWAHRLSAHCTQTRL